MKRGGQPKAPQDRKSHNFTFRVRPATKAMLEGAAHKAGRSVSDEIERRIERTFIEDHERKRDATALRELEQMTRDYALRIERLMTPSLKQGVAR